MQDFLWTLACADPALVRECPADEQRRLTIIGLLVGGIGLTTGLSGYYAAGLLFNQFHSTLLLGLLWGLMFTNLYRYMLGSVGFYDGLHRHKNTGAQHRTRPWGSVLLRAGLVAFFSFVMAQPVELFLLRGPIAPRLARAQAAQRARLQATLRGRFRRDSLEAAARLARLDSAAQLLAIGVQQAQSRQAQYEAASRTDWRLGAAVRAAETQQRELQAQLAAVQTAQQPERQALAAAEADRQAAAQAALRRFDAQQQEAGTLLLQLHILHAELPWAGLLTVGVMAAFLLPLFLRTFRQARLADFVRRSARQDTWLIRAAYSQFKLEYAAAMHASTGRAVAWAGERYDDPRTWEKQVEQEEEAFANNTAGAETGRLAGRLRGFATTSPLPAAP